MSYYKAINYWTLGGFDAQRSALDALGDVKDIGLDGIELTFGDVLPETITKEACAKIRARADALGVGLRTLASGRYWQCSLASEDAAERKAAVAFTRHYIDAASWLGVGKILVIPGAVDVGWDPSRPVTPYKKVWDNALASLRGLLSYAEEKRVVLCLENVWNKFLYSPLEFRRFLAELDSRWAGAYFDMANCVVFGYPEHWIEILNDKIEAVHVKNFTRQDAGGILHGFGEDLREGDVDFDAVKAALAAVAYDGPLTLEMVPFSRLPNLGLPDLTLARASAKSMREIFA
jgi:L-ribulose-5-phosphate 3-epimerase